MHTSVHCSHKIAKVHLKELGVNFPEENLIGNIAIVENCVNSLNTSSLVYTCMMQGREVSRRDKS